MSLGRITEPFNAIGKDRDRCIVNRCSLGRPAGVPNHDLIQRETFFGSANKDLSRYFWNIDHKSGLASNPLVVGGVVHDAHGPGHRSFNEFQLALEQNATVPKLRLGLKRELLLAVVILSKSCELVEEAAAHSD